MNQVPRPTTAFVGVSWIALVIGAVVYLLGLWNSTMALNEKGYYFVLLMYGMFATVSLQKSVRDRLEGQRVSSQYYGIAWASVGICLALLAYSLVQANLTQSEKGFYVMAYLMCLFGVTAVQKNTRDLMLVAGGSDADGSGNDKDSD